MHTVVRGHVLVCACNPAYRRDVAWRTPNSGPNHWVSPVEGVQFEHGVEGVWLPPGPASAGIWLRATPLPFTSPAGAAPGLRPESTHLVTKREERGKRGRAMGGDEVVTAAAPHLREGTPWVYRFWDFL